MVKENKDDKGVTFICEECQFRYADKDLAQKCEDWCREHHSCNIEITKHAIQN